MAIKNDDRIIELKKQIETKRKQLSEKTSRFSPETNCILEFKGTTYNLNICSAEMLTLLLVELNMYVMSAADLGITLPVISGYPIEMWMTDIKNKISALSVKQEDSNLKKMEAKLDKLLSDDKKTELELDEIASLLG